MKNKMSASECLIYLIGSAVFFLVGICCFVGGLVGDVHPDNLYVRSVLVFIGILLMGIAGKLFEESN